MTEPMGHGVNQRNQIKMTPEEVDAFLHERMSMTMSTISPDGSIHSVAMWYGFLEGAVAFETKTKSQKVQNLRRDRRHLRRAPRRVARRPRRDHRRSRPDVGARGQCVRAVQRSLYRRDEAV